MNKTLNPVLPTGDQEIIQALDHHVVAAARAIYDVRYAFQRGIHPGGIQQVEESHLKSPARKAHRISAGVNKWQDAMTTLDRGQPLDHRRTDEARGTDDGNGAHAAFTIRISSYQNGLTERRLR